MNPVLPKFGKGVFHADRRRFLRAAAVAFGAVAARAGRGAEAPAVRVRFGMITDVHYADTDPRGRRRYRAAMDTVRRAVTFMNRGKPDFLVELGDFKDQDTPPDPARTLGYVRAVEAEFRKFAGPVHHVIGNHDVDSLAKEEFLGEISNGGAEAKAFYSFDVGGAHFVVLDANFSLDGTPYRAGRFDWKDANVPAPQLEWLRKDLAAAKGPALVFVHQRLDGEGPATARNAAEVRAVLEKSGRVKAVFQGHDHPGGFSRIGGIDYHTLKSVIEAADGEEPWAVAELAGDRLTVRGAAVVGPSK